MRILPQIDVATRLTQAGKLGEALAALTGDRDIARTVMSRSSSTLAGEPVSTLREALDTSLGALGRLATPLGFKGRQDAPSVPDGASFTERSFASSAGSLAYKLYVPRRAGTDPLPLVVMLHGCTQSPDDFATGTRMNAHAEAEAEGFYVAYPAQSQTANPQKCWNWFRAVDQGRGGEPALIVAMVREILRSENVDPARVYVAGLSAGGAAAAVLGQAYPEIFAAVGVHSGLACGAAADMPSAFAAMRSGAMAPRGGAAVPIIVFHGDRDATVAPINGEQVLAQAAGSRHLSTAVETTSAPGGLRYTRTVRADATGRALSEHWLLHGAKHAWSGGDPSGSYTDPRGPDASLAMLRFFSHHKQGERERI